MGEATSLVIEAGPVENVATLMLPEAQWDSFHQKKESISKSSQGFIEYLLRRYQEGENLKFAKPERFAAHYQARGLNLRKFNFTICPVVWHRFRCLARYYGVSMCWLLVAMLLDLKKIGTTKTRQSVFLVKLYEKLRVSSKTALRFYKTSHVEMDTS